VHRRKNRLGNHYFWHHTKSIIIVWTNFAKCQLFFDFSDQTVRHDNLTVHVQEWYVTCGSSSVQIQLQDVQYTVERLYGYWSLVGKHKLNSFRNWLITFKWVMSYELWKEWFVCNTNLSVWQPSCCIHAFIQLSNSQLRPGVHGKECENRLSCVMEIEEKELDQDCWGCRTLLNNIYLENQHTMNSELIVWEYARPTLSITQIMCVVVVLKIWVHKVSWCKWLYIQPIAWFSIIIIWFISYSYWTYTDG